MSDDVLPGGPIFGPDSVVIAIDDGMGGRFDLPIYPDAHNDQLKAASQAAVFYFQPTKVYLARRNSSDDLDFSMKAMVTRRGGGAVEGIEYVGGACTFTTTMALTDAMTNELIAKLTSHDHASPPERVAPLFNVESAVPVPELRMIPNSHNAVSCFVPQATSASGPIFLAAQPNQIGSIEMHARNTFLVSCNASAAEIIVANLRNGTSTPFVLSHTLTEQFDMAGETLNVNVRIDVGKLYDAFAATMPQGDSRALLGQSPNLAFHAGLTGGAIATQVTENTQVMEQALKEWIETSNPVKIASIMAASELLFDIAPVAAPVLTDAKWWNDIFAGSAVSLKSRRPEERSPLSESIMLSGAVATEVTIYGEFNALAAATKADITKYLTVIDMSGFE